MDKLEENSFGVYQQAIRDKASGSLSELKSALERQPIVFQPEHHHRGDRETDGGRDDRQRNGGRETKNRDDVEHSDYSYGVAVNRLKTLLTKTSPSPSPVKTILFSTRNNEMDEETSQLRRQPVQQTSHTRLPDTHRTQYEIPTPEEALPLLKNEAARVVQLENDKTFLKAELHSLQCKIGDVIEENRALHEELRASVIQEIMQSDIQLPQMAPPSFVVATDDNKESLNKFHHVKLKSEMEKMKSLHLAKTERLESQLGYTREEISKYEKLVNDLESKVRMLESLQNADPTVVGLAAGLCIQCAENEALLPPSLGMIQKQNIESLTRDREELSAQVTLFKCKYDEMHKREEGGYQQIKKSYELAEQAQIEMTQALIEREQVKDELSKTRSRFEDYIAQMQENMSEECELVRRDGETRQHQLDIKMKELVEKLAESQVAYEKCLRDKMTIHSELDIAKNQLSTADGDFNKATDNMKINMTQATMERNVALQQLERMRQELDQLDSDRHAERSRLKTEIEDLRRRLHQAENDLLVSKEQCISLHNDNQALHREMHLIKLAKESLEHTLTDDLSSVEREAELREAELNRLIDNLHIKNEQRTKELEELLQSHELLIHKLREECRNLVKQLEDVTSKYKADEEKLRQRCEHSKIQVKQLLKRCPMLDEQLAQQNQLREKLTNRMKQLDGHLQHVTKQNLDLLAKESILMRDRQELERHVKFLSQELLSSKSSRCIEEEYDASRDVFNNIINDEDSTHVKNPLGVATG